MPPIWRSNHVIGTLCQLHWIIYLLRPTETHARENAESAGFLFQIHLHTITLLQTDITRLATIVKNKMLAISSKSSSSSSAAASSPLYVSKQSSQGSFEIFTNEDPNAITPMSIVGKQKNKQKDKKQSSHNDKSHSSTKTKPTVKGRSTGEGGNDRNKELSSKRKRGKDSD